MGMAARVVAAVAAASAPVLGLGAAPAEAVEDQATASDTFRDHGVEITCTIEGFSAVSYDPGSEKSLLRASVALPSDGDPRCTVGNGMEVHGRYVLHGEAAEQRFVIRGGSGSRFVGTEFTVPGVVVSLDVAHFVEFRCDEEPSGDCGVLVTTSPK